MVVALIIAVLEALVIIALVIVIYKSEQSYSQIRNKAEQIVKGKLDVEDIRVDGKQNNTTILARAFNSIKSNLLTFVEATKGNVIVLSDALDVLSKSVEGNRLGNEQIADGVSTVAVKAAEQLDLVKSNLDIIEVNNVQMQEIDSAMAKMKAGLDDTVEVSKKGLGHLKGYEIDMDAISDDLGKSNEFLEKFNEDIKKIEVAGDFIISVSDQLRLLALNASIEAARAGQAGRGFSVVADEMSDMSDKTKAGMGTITKIVNEIMESSQQVNDSIKNCEGTFNKSKETFEEVSNSFQTINRQAFEIHDSIKQISGKFETIAQNSNESKEMASRLYDASLLISDSTHEIAAASQETAAESSHIGDNVDALSGMLKGIQDLLKQFNTSVVPVNQDRGRKVHIAFISMLDNDFWYGVRRGVFYAQKELAGRNALVEYTPINMSGSELDEFVSNRFQECIDQNVDGIIFPGFLSGGNANLQRAIDRGINVFAFNCDCASDVKRMACFSPDAYEAGLLAAKSVEKALGRTGNVVVMTGDLSVRVNLLRKESFLKGIAACKGIRVVDDIVVLDNADDVYENTCACLRSRADVDAIYLTTGMPLSVARAIEDTGRAGRTVLIGFDHSPEIYDYIKKGVIAAAIGQDPFGQGHDPIIWMYNHCVTGEALPKEFMACRLSVVDKDNVENLI